MHIIPLLYYKEQIIKIDLFLQYCLLYKLQLRDMN